jgi:hypothetical protein
MLYIFEMKTLAEYIKCGNVARLCDGNSLILHKYSVSDGPAIRSKPREPIIIQELSRPGMAVHDKSFRACRM